MYLEVAHLIRRHFLNIPYCSCHLIISAGLDPVNATTQSLRRTALGFRNDEAFKTTICSHCGGLQFSTKPLDPQMNYKKL